MIEFKEGKLVRIIGDPFASNKHLNDKIGVIKRDDGDKCLVQIDDDFWYIWKYNLMRLNQ